MNTVFFASVIADLYSEAGTPLPTVDRPLVPLSDLVGAYDLTCTELTGLTSATAIQELLRRGGIVEPPERLSHERLAGFIYTAAHIGAIFVERADYLVRRRFSVAHELGHYLLHFRPLLQAGESDEPSVYEAMEAIPFSSSEAEPDQMPVGRMTFTRPAQSTASQKSFRDMEREANQFAGELLMPKEIVQGLVEHHARAAHGEDLIWRIATDMLVSRSAMRWRLRFLGLL
jgi:Zn-dependent peptidase ImmA (M78 family)